MSSYIDLHFVGIWMLLGGLVFILGIETGIKIAEYEDRSTRAYRKSKIIYGCGEVAAEDNKAE